MKNLPSRRALITGISGQDGYYLSKFLHSKGYEVFGLIHDASREKRKELDLRIPFVHLIRGNLTNEKSLTRALRTSQPHEVYNLAAKSHVNNSWSHPKLTSQITAQGVLNLLEAIRVWNTGQDYQLKFYQASSSEMFGRTYESPQNEKTLLWPRSPYGASKAFGHHMTINYRENYGLHASSGILFNHESPLRPPEFVSRKISLGVAKIKLGMQKELTMGNLQAARDWGFAGDYVEAMWLMTQQEVPGDYVISTGVMHTVKDFLEIAFRAAEIPNWESRVSVSNDLLRRAEIDQLVGDSRKARSILGWEPKVKFEELVHLMVKADIRTLSQA